MTAVLAGPMDDLSEEMVSQDMTSDELWEMNKDNNAYQESIPQGDNEYLIEGPTVQGILVAIIHDKTRVFALSQLLLLTCSSRKRFAHDNAATNRISSRTDAYGVQSSKAGGRDWKCSRWQ